MRASLQAPDFPTHVAQIEQLKKPILSLAFDSSSDDLLYKLDDLMEELEYIRSTWRDRSFSENREAIQEQMKRML